MDTEKGGDVLMVTVELHAFPVKSHTEYEIVKYNGNVIVSRVRLNKREMRKLDNSIKLEGF